MVNIAPFYSRFVRLTRRTSAKWNLFSFERQKRDLKIFYESVKLTAPRSEGHLLMELESMRDDNLLPAVIPATAVMTA